jgi:glycosyltransferase involved in cell wall biosynthesis
MIKILHVIKSLGRGGAETLLPETLKLHNRQEFDFHYIYFLPWKNQMVESIASAGGKVTCIPANNNAALILKVNVLVRYIREHQIDVVHAHLPWAGVVARLAGKIAKVPVLYTEHNKQERYHFLTRLMNLRTMNLLTGIIAVSQDVETSIRRYKPNLKAPLRTILNGVNTEHFAPGLFSRDEVCKELGIPPTSQVIGTIAVFRFQKRLDVWIEIAKKILVTVPDTHFIIVGDGPLAGELKEKVKQLKLERNVHFPGLKTEVRPYLAAFNIYMMTSLFEGLPIALLEAMSSGVPVVSTNAGGIKEVIVSKDHGLLCDVDDPFALTGMAASLLRDHSAATQLGTGARNRVEHSFSLAFMVQKLEEFYRTTVKG